MQILLMCKEESVSSALTATRVQGEEVPARVYIATNNQMILAGWPDVVLHHDADELLKNPLFRMPTPQEQEAFTQGQFRATTVQEGVFGVDSINTTDELEQAPKQALSMPGEPPAVKKVSGG